MSTESHIVHVQGVNELAAPVTESVRELERWEKAGENASAAFQASADKARASMGVWAQMSDEALSKVKGNFDLLQREWRSATKLLADGLKDGQVNLGIDGLKERLAGEERLLTAARMRQDVMRSEIAAQGALTTQGQQNLALANMEIATRERSIDALRIKIGGYERETIAIRDQALAMGELGKADNAAAQAQTRGAISAGQHRAAMQQLGYQLGDVATSFAAGTPPAMIFGQQMGQVTQAIGLLDGGGNKFIEFLRGPWGVGITVAMVALSPFIAKLWEGGEAADQTGSATDRLTNKLDVSHNSYKSLIAVVNEYNKAQSRSEVLTLAAANAAATEASKLIVLAKAKLAVLRASNPSLNSGSALDAINAEAGNDQLIRYYEGQLAQLQKDLASSGVTIGTEKTKRAVDPVYDKQQEYADKLFKLDEKRKANLIDQVSYEKERVRLKKEELAATEKIRDADRAAHRTPREQKPGTGTAQFSPNDIGGMLKDEIGGTVTSTTGGKHAKNSFHYSGQAVDFVPSGGMASTSKAEIRAMLEAKGVSIKELLGPGDKGHSDHYHVAFDKARRGQDSIEKRAENAKLAMIANQLSYNQDERDARHRLLDATRKTATSETQRDQLLRDDINADANARKDKIALQEQQGKISAAEAKHLNELEEQTRAQKLQNVDIERAAATLREATDLRALDLETQIAMAQIEVDMADTAKLRQAAELKLLNLKDEHVRVVANAVIADKNASTQEVQGARDTLKVLSASRPQREDDIRKQNASPMDQYKQRLTDATKDIDTALSEIQANGLSSLEDGLAGIITGTESVAGAFKKMANQIIADLIRIAVQKLILSAISGGTSGFFGLKSGGKIEGKAGGGMIRGPGTGTSDSILALVDGIKPLLVSNGESIVTAEATAKYWPLIEAMNKGMSIPGFAGGGFTSSLSAPRLPAFWDRYRSHTAPVQNFHINAAGAILAADLIAETRRIGMQAALGGAALAQQRADERAMSAIPQ